MIRKHLIILAIFGFFVLACTEPSSTGVPSSGISPSAIAEGERLFKNNCAGCHGIGAQGTDRGPTFISKIYEPGHHGDPAFHLAVKNGVRAHHWDFGNMPKISGVSPEAVEKIISYVRSLQREAGIS